MGFSINKWFVTGEAIEAKTHEDVTMLFSDIVGFTSICSTATPMMVINMLQDLYNQFDVYCGQLDVYKVSEEMYQQATNTPNMATYIKSDLNFIYSHFYVRFPN